MTIKNVFVVGAGLMGFGIAQVSAEAGFNVKVYDISVAALNKGLDGCKKNMDKRIAKGKITEEYKASALSKLKLVESLEEAADADLIIEAALEKYDVKSEIFKELSNIVPENAIVATNTSSLSVSKLGTNIKNRSRFIGMHFFSPVPVMKLMEIVVGLETSAETVETVKEFGAKINKEMIVSRDEPGFIVNRMIDPMGNEAVHLVEKGVCSIEDIDKGCKFGLNHPIGPLELMDAAGIDIEYAVMKNLFEETGDPKYRPAILMRRMVECGYVGKKAGKGFYVYHEDGTKSTNPDVEHMIGMAMKK